VVGEDSVEGDEDVGPTSISVWYVTPCDTYRHKGEIGTTPKNQASKEEAITTGWQNFDIFES